MHHFNTADHAIQPAQPTRLTAKSGWPRARSLVPALIATALAPAALLTSANAAPRTDNAAAAAAKITDWATCPESTDTQCGTLHVPLDWTKPTGKQIAITVARRPADDPKKRIGTLFYNPGGPGDTPIPYIVQAKLIFSDTLRAKFDIVGLDPRAVGETTRVTCKVHVYTADTTLFPKTEEQFNQLRRRNRAVGESCLKNTGAFLSNTDTRNVARDHEALRVALGVKQVSWLGLSYGTQVAANYAELYPTATRAMALDAALEHSQPELQQVADEIVAAEDSFNRFATWCTTATSCVLKGQDVGAVFDRLVEGADKRPIPVSGAIHAITGEDIRMTTKGLLRFKEPSVFGPDKSWAGLSKVLKAAIDGDASAYAIPADAPQDGLFAQLAIACMEYAPQIHTYEQMRQRIEMARQLAPHLQGASETWQVNFCIDWPLRPTNPPRTLHVSGVPTLMVHATHDPSDPYRWTHSLAGQISGASILTRTGDGHTSYNTSKCARAAVDAYLVTPKAPASTTCSD
jgi:pimeloyl-ACP methyl ester carboxylesterase